MQPLPNDKENPWMGNVKTGSEMTDFIDSYRKYWDDPTKQSKNQDANVSTNSKVDVKQVETSSKDTEHLSILKGITEKVIRTIQ